MNASKLLGVMDGFKNYYTCTCQGLVTLQQRRLSIVRLVSILSLSKSEH